MKQDDTLPNLSETAISNAIINHLTDLGCIVVRINSSRVGRLASYFIWPFGISKGLPDLLVLHGARFAFVEVKTQRGTLNQAQRAVHAEFAKRGIPVCVARSVEDADAFVRQTMF